MSKRETMLALVALGVHCWQVTPWLLAPIPIRIRKRSTSPAISTATASPLMFTRPPS